MIGMKFFFTILLMSLVFTACETKDLIGAKEYNYTRGDLNEGSLESGIEFDGIQSISQVTDSSVILNWINIEDASSYYIYVVENGSPTFIESVFAPAEEFLVSGLKNGTTYNFMVRAKDSNGQLDANEVMQSAVTLSSPISPSILTMANPLFNHGTEPNPHVLVFGVNPGDTVRVYSDNCSTQVGSAIASLSYVRVELSGLSVGTSYSFKADRYTVNKQSSSCSVLSVNYELTRCPHGYVYVPKDSDLESDPFCVMQYEAKPWSDSDSDNKVDSIELHSSGCNESACTTKDWGTASYKPGSSAYGHPWRMVTIETAKELCQTLGDDYDLISNDEWMILAKSIEAHSNNWTGGVLASGKLFKGNNGLSNINSYDSIFSTGVDLGIGRNSLAALTYFDGSSNETIWDLSGNLAEWVDWGQEDYVSYINYLCPDDWADLDINFCDGKLNEEDYLPFNPGNITSGYNNEYGLGLIEGGLGRALLRGGSYRNGEYTGLFNASFAYSVNSAQKDIGFRCVYRKPVE